MSKMIALFLKLVYVCGHKVSIIPKIFFSEHCVAGSIGIFDSLQTYIIAVNIIVKYLISVNSKSSIQ